MEKRKRLLPTLMAVAIFLIPAGLGLFPSITTVDAEGWPEMGQNAEHAGTVDVAAQRLDGLIADLVFDPFAPQEQDEGNDMLQVHYQAPLISHDDVFMEFETGMWRPCEPPGSGTRSDGLTCGTHAWDQKTWNEKRLHWENDALIEQWTFASDWKPEPDGSSLNGWEPVFHAVLTDRYVFVPGFAGTIYKLNQADGTVVAHLNPFEGLDPNIYVSGPLTADSDGNVFYNVIKLDPNDPWGTDSGIDGIAPDVGGSWLVKVDVNDTITKVSYSSLVTDAPAMCTSTFRETVPWPPSPTAKPPVVPCLSQRPGINVAPAVAPDGTIYTISRAHNRFAVNYAYLVAVNRDLSPKWAASLRDRLNDGCNVTLPPNGTPGGCSDGAITGVDPATNELPAGQVIDQSSSSPTVLPDGSIVYTAYTRYNYSRGHLFKFSAAGDFLGAYGAGYDITPAVYVHDNSYSLIIKENHYDRGSYCIDPTYCPPAPSGPYFITQLSADLKPEWQFKSIGSVDDPGGKEWCINALPVDHNGTVYATAEDGNLYAINQGGVETQRLFLGTATAEAYTPVVIGPDGLLYMEKAGHLLVIGSEKRKTISPLLQYHPAGDH